MNKRIKELAEQAGLKQRVWNSLGKELPMWQEDPDNPGLKKFAELIIKECIDKIETYRIPVGNSSAGELACEWTYAALKEIRDDIKETFGVE
jgi:hypothetical protein